MAGRQESIDEVLRRLSASYASGVDGRNVELLLSAFREDAVLEIYAEPADEPSSPSILRGHSEIARIVGAIGRYRMTFHLLGQSRFEVRGDRADGEVYCVASHYLERDGAAMNRVMYIRYEDEYQLGPDDGWGIARRRVRPSWTEERPIKPELDAGRSV